MTPSVESIVQAAAGLSSTQKLSLANRLLAGIESASDSTADAAWDAVIRERRAQYEAGEAKTCSVEEVFAEVDRRLKAKS